VERSSHVNIDGDVVVYAVGFAAQTTWHVVDGKRFEDKADAITYCEKYGIDADTIEKEIEPEPIEHCLSSVKRMLANVQKKAKATTRSILLTGDGNFRETVATLQPYKGNRSNTAKPYWYDDIIAYLVDVQGAEVIEGEEADDQLSIRAMAHGHTIATIDKDLDNTPGWHYNWNHDRLYYVEPLDADRNFYKQLFTGDSTDNIPGLYRTTGVRAKKAWKDAIDEMTDVRRMYDHVLDVYAESLANKADTSIDDLVPDDVEFYYEDARDIINEIGQLLWMRREEGETWKPPKHK